ncbi:MAG TPA: hypothetical protein VJB89_01160 [Candidatus Nanoarchaeia archaeon]|nr:hypothetical protein [Candidatus Nanoarchaeia archaeon]
MDKDSFLDTNVIINYSRYVKEGSSYIEEKCFLFISNKKGRFILCGAVLEELSKFSKKKAFIHKIVIDKIKNESINFENILSKKEIPFAKKLYEIFKDKDIKEVAEKLSFERDILQISIDKFLNSKVDETVINIEEIDNELVNKIHDFIDNHADCKILASALQFQSQTNREIFLFVTADEKDFSPNGYKFLIDQFVIIGLNKKYKFPELYNLRFTN